MARYKHLNKKKRIIVKNRITKWAPFWTVFKIYGIGRRVHPGRHTAQKRNWRRTKLKI